MQILYEHEVNADVGLLDQAWSEPRTFAFMPDKSGVSADWLRKALEKLPEDLQTEHFALLTSASTGMPKLVIGNRNRAKKLVKLLHDLQESAAVDQTIVVLPLSYCYAFVNQWLWARQFNRHLVLTYGFSEPDTLKESLAHAHNSMLCLVGAQIQLFSQYFASEKFPGVIRLHFAGGRFPQEQLDEIRGFFPHARIFNNYGCAEAMPRLTLRHAKDAKGAYNIGKPLPEVQLKIGNGDELLFKSPYGAVAFVDEFGMHVVTSEDWVSTGDLARSHEDGSWQLIGRSNEVFKRYGEKIALSRLLATVKTQWKGQVAFCRETDSSGEEGCVLVLTPIPSDAEVRALLKSFRANHKRPYWPLRIESINMMPYLPNGKIDTRALTTLNNKTIHWRQKI